MWLLIYIYYNYSLRKLYRPQIVFRVVLHFPVTHLLSTKQRIFRRRVFDILEKNVSHVVARDALGHNNNRNV